MQVSKNFTVAEFRTGEGVLTSLALIDILQTLRNSEGPVKVRSIDIEQSGGTYKLEVNVSYGPGDMHTKVSSSLTPDSVPIYGGDPAVGRAFVNEFTSKGMSLPDSLDCGTLLAVTAALQNGYRERAGNDNVFGRFFNFNGYPWCALFFHWCRRCVSDIRGLPENAFEPWMSSSLETLKRAPVVLNNPADAAPGDAVIWKREGTALSGHTGICLKNDKKRRMLLICEGNLADAIHVSERSYNRLDYGSLKLRGFARYTAEINDSRPDLFRKPSFGVHRPTYV